MRFVLIGTAILALAACHKPAQEQQPPTAKSVAAEAGAPVKGVDRSHRGEKAPHVILSFAGKETEDFGEIGEGGGIPTLVNLWATWCAPCVKELPTLNKLDEEHDSDRNFQVVAISQDDGPHQSVEAFLKSKAPRLDPYQDPKMALSGALGAEVLPTSILFDAQGREVWRYVGDLDWASPQAAKLLAEGGVAAPKKH